MKDQIKRMRVGEGRISGAISIFLGSLSLVGILCFKFPEQLTTPEFREVYTAEIVENLMLGGIIATFLFALVSILLNKNKQNAVIGTCLGVLAIVFGGITAEGRAVQDISWSIGLDWLILDLLIMALLFVPIELAFPKNKRQSKFHEEWRTDLIYFGISHLAIQLFGVITKKPAVAFFGWMNLDQVHVFISELPFLVELFLALFITDIFQYWAHRFFHSHHYLWRFHSIHHSTQNMDWLAGSRTHFIDIFFTRSVSYIPLYVLGFSTLTFNVYILFIAIHAVLIHANTRINFGFLKYIITTPQYHHWHHCEEPEHYGNNFAVVFPFIDKIFGTYHLPGKEWPKGTGLIDATFPKGFVKQLFFPFTKNPFKNDLLPEEKSNR
ncbi:sterol desaturase family protein [Tenacibaculum ovolyticum]|jgi:lathosterol oxidase|uniref:sterol desaturase family protein n=1 Tax=Tenacibaculum ovolyticum TaxID=104270 RepID=UPI0007ECC1C9|nr:sterol desaturase family protein [Tenacibaculum ovolyticum]WBX75782.1 sterol desaturase family protein [Tenacibaculum ovolyticum]